MTRKRTSEKDLVVSAAGAPLRRVERLPSDRAGSVTPSRLHRSRPSLPSRKLLRPRRKRSPLFTLPLTKTSPSSLILIGKHADTRAVLPKKTGLAPNRNSASASAPPSHRTPGPVAYSSHGFTYLYFRKTARRRPCICTSAAATRIGFSAELAGCSRTMSSGSR